MQTLSYGLLLLTIASAACTSVDDSFQCTVAAQCTDGAKIGRCESGYCAFLDGTCTSMWRYDRSAQSPFAGSCTSDVTADGGTDLDGGAPAGLIGHWPLDDTTGAIAVDTSGNGNDGILTGTVARIAGEHGGAMQLSKGSAFSVAALAGTAFPQQAGTLSFWFMANLATAPWPIFDNYDPTRDHLFVRTYQPNQLQIAAASSTKMNYIGVENPSASSNAWHHIVVAWQTGSGGTLTVYLDGAPGSTALNDDAWRPSAQQFVMGGDQPVLALDEIELYDRALSASEIAQLP